MSEKDEGEECGGDVEEEEGESETIDEEDEDGEEARERTWTGINAAFRVATSSSDKLPDVPDV